MKCHTISKLLSVFLLCGALTSTIAAQQSNCLPPVALPAQTEPNIFSQEQEVFLGEAFAERIQKDYRIIEDAELTGYLTRIGERLVKHLPLSKIQLQFFIVDLPDANAFVLPGGRVYVARKLIALVQSEDELAGVISHELGHLAARDSAVDFTRLLKEVLGVTQVTERRDIFEKYNQLIDNAARKNVKLPDREKGQMVADQMGFYALVSAGYDPSAQARFWDRMTEIKGKKGNFFSDLFGTTKPEERRYREMMKAVSSLPAGCVQTRTVAQADEFKSWQSSVITYTGLGRREALHGVLSKQQLSPPLRSDISALRFSPDGKYILAQDDAGINVLAREPFALLFRIEAPDATRANFTPDSQSIIFATDNLRIERWSVAEQKMLSAKEVVVLNGCLQTQLSPDGKYLACLNPKFDLQVLDVAAGQPVIKKKEFYQPDYWQAVRLIVALIFHGADSTDYGIKVLNMDFSPDSRYFVAGYYGRTTYLSNRWDDIVEAFDMTALAKISLPDVTKKFITGGFAFMDSDRIVGANRENTKKSGVIEFLTGKTISEFPLYHHDLAAPTRGNYVLIRPLKNYAVGVMETATGNIVKASEQPALDMYDDVFVAEMRNGQLGLYRTEKNVVLGTAILSNNTLGRMQVTELSPDMKWLALSGRSRGGVWSVEQGKAALYLRGFRGGYVSTDGFFFGDFPKYQEAERNIAKFNLASGDVVPGTKIEANNAHQIGPYLTLIKSAKQQPKEGEVLEYGKTGEFRKNVVLEFTDARTMALLWSKPYPLEAPRVWVAPNHNTTALVWNVTDEAAKAEIKADPSLSQRLTAMKEKEGDYLLNILDARNGNELGKLLIETGKGSFRLTNVYAAGDWVIITDTQNRVLIYSLKTGELKGRVFSSYTDVSTVSDLLCVENESGKLAVYDLNTMQKRDSFTFASPLALVRFSEDGRRLFVLTTNQTAYLLDAAQIANSTTAAKQD